MGKNGVKVIIRTRPTAAFATNQIQIDSDENAITVYSNAGAPSSPTRGDGRSSSPERPRGEAAATTGPSNRKDCWRFRFHQVLHNASQDKVYEAIARDIVHGAVVDGVNGTILAYGQTGAGKSFTMIGDTRNYQHRGIAPRAIAQVYEEVENRIEIAYSIRVSYMEIYNDRIYDLLESFDPNSGAESDPYRGDLVVVEDSRGTYVRGLTQIDVTSEQEALDQLFNGELQRTVAEHQLNKRSNRSHCIFTLHISQKSRAGGNERVTHSKLHLVDLAGSERLKKTMDDGNNSHSSTIKKESILSFLEQCIVALGAKEQRHIPYRQTKLTNVLKDSLGGNSNTLMFACIWGESKHLEETISTLKLAQRMMRVQNEVASVVESDPMILLRKYEKQIKELKHELVMHDALVERTGIVYDEHTPEQKHQLMRMVQSFLDAATPQQEDDALRLSSIHEIRELFRQFKILYKNLESEALAGGGLGGSLRAQSAGSSASRSQTSNGSRTDIHHSSGLLDGHHGALNGHDLEFVGEDDPTAPGFGLGIASGAARPTTMDAQKKKGRGAASDGNGAHDDDARSRHRSPSPTRTSPQQSDEKARGAAGSSTDKAADGMDEEDREVDEAGAPARTLSREARLKNEAFKFYKSTGTGKKIYRSLQEEKDKLFDSKQKVKMISNRLNGIKAQIDDVKAKLDEKRSHRGGTRGAGSVSPVTSPVGKRLSKAAASSSTDEVVDEEEFLLMTAEREAKRDYRSLFDDLKEARAEMEFTNRSVELLRMRLVREFEDWYDEEGRHLAAIAKDDDELGGGGSVGFSFGAVFSREDKMDDGEKFDQMEVERVRAQDPDSLAFFQAQKKLRGQLTTGSSSNAQRKGKRGV
ncbi:hypothetical protein P43SY_001147 [Pythium insidiosum]|uniref:Kinesin-like protein n=1 Tax=Pythium insidiosum TaxID=114742 RepID=A0AAD5LCH9_PYTIN|nr:hypothetical protein P43SY_001147 [Pythium insidiosum]